MKRKIKKGSGIYTFLEASGLLKTGSNADIEQAKKQYWATVRKEYKKTKRQRCKGYTVFLNYHELKIISKTAQKQRINSITTFIKQASIAYCNNQFVIDKVAIGEIRQALSLHYMAIQTLRDENIVPHQVADKLLKQIIFIETKTMNLVQQF